MLSQESIRLGKQRSVIRDLFEYGQQRAAVVGPENVFDFSLGNPSVCPPPEVNGIAIRLLCTEDPVKMHGYTSATGDMEVRKKFAASLNRRYAADCKAENLYICTGAAGALCGTLHGLAVPGDEFITQAPFFPEYRVFVQKTGATLTVLPADTEAFQINFDALAAALNPNVKGMIINTPNNPSGAVYTAETLRKLAALLHEKELEYGHPIYLISDEPYRELVYDGYCVTWVPHLYANTIVCYSFSKSLSLPGERLGYIYVPSACEAWQDVFAAVAGASRALGYVSAPSLFQRVCAECCDMTVDISVYARNRALLLDLFKSCGMSCVAPGGTFYVFPKTLIPDDVAFCEQAKALDLLIVPGTGFGCPGYTRVAFCVPTERIERSFGAFRKLAEIYNGK